MVVSANSNFNSIAFSSDSKTIIPVKSLKEMLKSVKSDAEFTLDFLDKNKEGIECALKRIKENETYFTQRFNYNGNTYELRAYKDIHSGEYKGKMVQVSDLGQFYNTCLRLSCK